MRCVAALVDWPGALERVGARDVEITQDYMGDAGVA